MVYVTMVNCGILDIMSSPPPPSPPPLVSVMLLQKVHLKTHGTNKITEGEYGLLLYLHIKNDSALES